MNLLILVLWPLISSPLLIQAKNFCPPLGPVYPTPRNISSTPAGISVAVGLATSLDAALKSGSINGSPLDADNVSFSIQFSSLNEPNRPLFEYHHSAVAAALNTSSTQKVTADSIYRIGSISKVFIPYALLIAKGPGIFNERITNFVPELEALALEQEKKLNIIDQVIWKEVTLGSLASHTSGLGNICRYLVRYRPGMVN